jgi:REP element-mobilizing transposase RayT
MPRKARIDARPPRLPFPGRHGSGSGSRPACLAREASLLSWELLTGVIPTVLNVKQVRHERAGGGQAPGALHHIIIRGIERKSMFLDDGDRNDFLDRLGDILKDTSALCYAWALIPNHVHLLLRTGKVLIAAVMRRLLTGYALRMSVRRGEEIVKDMGMELLPKE